MRKLNRPRLKFSLLNQLMLNKLIKEDALICGHQVALICSLGAWLTYIMTTACCCLDVAEVSRQQPAPNLDTMDSTPVGVAQ